MRKDIAVDGPLQCLVGDKCIAVCRLRHGWDATEEREGARNRESDKQLSILHTSRPQ
jgi:hypothetical protein